MMDMLLIKKLQPTFGLMNLCMRKGYNEDKCLSSWIVLGLAFNRLLELAAIQTGNCRKFRFKLHFMGFGKNKKKNTV